MKGKRGVAKSTLPVKTSLLTGRNLFQTGFLALLRLPQLQMARKLQLEDLNPRDFWDDPNLGSSIGVDPGSLDQEHRATEPTANFVTTAFSTLSSAEVSLQCAPCKFLANWSCLAKDWLNT